MIELLNQSESLSNLGAVGLLAIIVVVICFFYRRDFIKELKASQDERFRCTTIQESLMDLVKTDIESRDKNAETNSRLAVSVEGLTQYLKGKLD